MRGDHPLVLGVVWAPAAALDTLVPAALSRAEIAAALRVADPEARAARLAGRALLVAVLARELGVRPTELPPLTRGCQHCGGQHGPPRLPRASVTASLSRSGGIVAVGWARTGRAVPAPPVGLDVVDPARPAPDPEAVLHPRERADLDRCPGASGPDHLRCTWARKEAVLKASGDGLAVDPASMDLGGCCPAADSDEAARSGTPARWRRVRSGGWSGTRVTDVQVGTLRGALAVGGGWSPPSRVDVRRWEA